MTEIKEYTIDGAALDLLRDELDDGPTGVPAYKLTIRECAGRVSFSVNDERYLIPAGQLTRCVAV